MQYDQDAARNRCKRNRNHLNVAVRVGRGARARGSAIGGSCPANCKRMAEKKSRGRTTGFVMSNEHRDKIAKSNILRYLIDHVEGNREMSSTQIQAGIALLKKALPDLQVTTLEGGDKALETKVTIGWQK